MAIIEKYSVQNHPVDIILGWYRSGEIAIPEIQRPFVWKSPKVRNLIDSLYRGYPIGYLIVWRNPNIRLKEGGTSEGKKILIDGQQRIMSLITSILGKEIVNSEYKKTRIIISFNPNEEKFEVNNPAIQRNPMWIKDIGPLIRGEVRQSRVVEEYCSKNGIDDRDRIEDTLENLKRIMSRPMGVVELVSDLDIEVVTEIFVRINSEGVPLKQADFAMSKIASSEGYDGNNIRNAIDYFCHSIRYSEFIDKIQNNDEEFTKTEFFKKILWLRKENIELYKPDYSDLLRVAFLIEFNRGKMADLVSLLSGRNFETKEYEERIARSSFEKLKTGIFKFINETNFKRFLMIIHSAGFVSPTLIRSTNALNFAYTLYLKLKLKDYDPAKIETYVRKWFVLSILTGRYSGSPESQFDYDIKQISAGDFGEFLKNVEDAELSDAFWNVSLIQKLNTSVASNPYFNVFLAAQVKANDKGFLSKAITMKDLITHRGDIHHIFPKEYLKRFNLKRGEYNQIANYVMTQSEINIRIGKKAPSEYMRGILAQCEGGEVKYGGITDKKELFKNLKENCIPKNIFEMDVNDYGRFLDLRRRLIAQKIKDYYFSL